MSVIPFPAPVDEEVVSDLSTAGLTVMEELAVARSWAYALGLRVEHFQVRRLRMVVLGAAIGATLAWLLDGEVAQKVDALLTWVGWS